MDENKKSECAAGRATTPASMTLGEAEAIIAGALERAAEMDLGPLTVAVLDPAGKLVALKRQDRSSLLRPDIAQAKAYGALDGHGLARPRGSSPRPSRVRRVDHGSCWRPAGACAGRGALLRRVVRCRRGGSVGRTPGRG